MTRTKGLVIFLILKQWFQVAGYLFFLYGAQQAFTHLLISIGLLLFGRKEGCTQGHRKAAIGREKSILRSQFQGITEALSQAQTIMQRTAQEHHLTLDTLALGQTGNRLIDHRLVDAGRHILLACALVQQGLYIRLGKDATARSNGIQALMA